jgi:hypothetical protein
MLCLIKIQGISNEETKRMQLEKIISTYELILSKEMYGHISTYQERQFLYVVSENIYSTQIIYHQNRANHS